MTSRRVAVVQAAPSMFDLAESLGRFESLLAKAGEAGAELTVFPEAFLGGYPKGLTFGATVGERTDKGRALFARYRRSAVEVPGDAFDAARAVVAQFGMYVVERAGRTLYCSAVAIAPDGALLGRHRKLVPTGTERIIWGRGDASDVAVIDTDIGRIGVAICWESYMPLYRTALYQREVQIYAAVIRGGSCFVDPFGRFLAGPSFDREDVLVTDIDLATLDGAYLDLDVVGHYARPDIVQLTVTNPEAPRSRPT